LLRSGLHFGSPFTVPVHHLYTRYFIARFWLHTRLPHCTHGYLVTVYVYGSPRFAGLHGLRFYVLHYTHCHTRITHTYTLVGFTVPGKLFTHGLHTFPTHGLLVCTRSTVAGLHGLRIGWFTVGSVGWFG